MRSSWATNRTPEHDLHSNFAPTSVFNLPQVGTQVGSQVGPKLGYRETPYYFPLFCTADELADMWHGKMCTGYLPLEVLSENFLLVLKSWFYAFFHSKSGRRFSPATITCTDMPSLEANFIFDTTSLGICSRYVTRTSTCTRNS